MKLDRIKLYNSCQLRPTEAVYSTTRRYLAPVNSLLMPVCYAAQPSVDILSCVAISCDLQSADAVCQTSDHYMVSTKYPACKTVM